jgi:uncharacterized protein YuzE
MKIQYFKDTDTLHIDISEKNIVETKEITEGFMVDFDKSNNIVGLELENASKIADLKRLETKSIPANNLLISQMM